MTLVKAGDGIVDIRGRLGGVYFHRDKSGLHSSSMPRKVHRRSAAHSLQRDAFVAARALSKDNRIVSYLMYRAMNGLPINYPDAWTLPTGYIDTLSRWNNPGDAYDDDEDTFADSTSVGGNEWNAPLEFVNPVPLTCSAVRVKADFRTGLITQIRIRIFYGGSYHLIYEGTFTDALTDYTGFGRKDVSKMEVGFFVYGSGRTQKIWEVAFYTLNNPFNNEPHYPVPIDYQIPHLQGPPG